MHANSKHIPQQIVCVDLRHFWLSCVVVPIITLLATRTATRFMGESIVCCQAASTSHRLLSFRWCPIFFLINCKRGGWSMLRSWPEYHVVKSTQTRRRIGRSRVEMRCRKFIWSFVSQHSHLDHETARTSAPTVEHKDEISWNLDYDVRPSPDWVHKR